MSKRLKSILLKYGICTIVSGLMTFFYVYSKNPSSLSQKDYLRVLCDGFFLPGVFITSFGLLFVVSNEGAFDGISWGLKYAFKALIPFGRLKKQESYAEYKEKKKDKQIKGFSFMIVIGGINLLISIILTIIFHQ